MKVLRIFAVLNEKKKKKIIRQANMGIKSIKYALIYIFGKCLTSQKKKEKYVLFFFISKSEKHIHEKVN